MTELDQLFNAHHQHIAQLFRAAAPTRPANVLLICMDVLPLPGLPTTGAGLRAWGIGQGLKARGHIVTFAMSDTAAGSVGYVGGHEDVIVFSKFDLSGLVRRYEPDVVVFQHWSGVGLLDEGTPGKVVIDLHGPLMLENLFSQGAGIERLYDKKLAAFARADFFTCAGERQRNYFYAWLASAGFDLTSAPPIAVVNFSLSPEIPPHTYPANEPIFVYGGVFLPWQDPALGLKTLVTQMDARGAGHLYFYGGSHPFLKMAPIPAFQEVAAVMQASSHVTVSPPVARDTLIEHYQRASVAWDLMRYNVERGMAFTSRTAEYLWTGLPVVYNDSGELSEYIADFDAGWVVNPDDKAAIEAVIAQIFAEPGEIARRGRNAQALAQKHLNWETSITPLHEYVMQPNTYPATRISGGPVVGWG